MNPQTTMCFEFDREKGVDDGEGSSSEAKRNQFAVQSIKLYRNKKIKTNTFHSNHSVKRIRFEKSYKYIQDHIYIIN